MLRWPSACCTSKRLSALHLHGSYEPLEDRDAPGLGSPSDAARLLPQPPPLECLRVVGRGLVVLGPIGVRLPDYRGMMSFGDRGQAYNLKLKHTLGLEGLEGLEELERPELVDIHSLIKVE